MVPFKELSIGDTFDFISPHGPNSFYDRCRKISHRKYQGIESNLIYTIGNISCIIYHVKRKEKEEDETNRGKNGHHPFT